MAESSSPSSSPSNSASPSPKSKDDVESVQDDASMDGGDSVEENDTADDEDMDDSPEDTKKTLLSKEEREALRKEEEAVLQEQRDRQTKSLDLVKQSLTQDAEWEGKSARDKKMAFLMAQSDVFTSFLMGGSSALGKEMSRTKAAKEAGSKRGKGSKQADAQTLQDMDDARYTRITQQPSIIKFDVEHSLPPKIETKLYVGLSEMQREWYMRVLHRDATHLNAIGGSDRVRLLNILMQLRKVDLQAMDRAHRIGQTKIVRVFRFITDGTVEEKIVERAERKLYLDAAIIQQGRLAQQNRKLSKDELMTMVRFGADEIFNARGSMITDDDIDAILARGEERTEAMKGKIAADMQHNLANFSLSGDNGNASVSSLYEFEGEVFSKDTNNGDILPSTFIALPQRERKSNYNEDEYYRQQAGLSKPKKPKKSGSDAAKVPVVHDYQFFQQERMVALLTKKTQVENRRKELTRLIKEAKADEARVKARKAKGEDSAENSAEEGGEDDDARSAALEKELNETEMDAADAKELEELEKEGFGDWTRRDLKQFINSCERYGRADRTRVCEEVSLVLGKDPAQVERYYDTFWSRHTELKDHAKYIEKIERGEKRLERNEVVKQALARKCSRYSHPLRDMRLHYPAGYKSKGYILEEDVFLVVMMNKYGPLEHWGEIRDEIRKAWQFRFDWFFKSRTIGELQKRGELLTRMIERENDELKSKSSKVEDDLAKKAKKSSSSKSKSKSSSSRSKTSSSSSSKKRSSSSKSSSSSSKKQRSSQ
ncbi:hypothetical protein PC116_g16067 [Phytophthora cactorum]|nr:hypothetical protein PC116_g16067 [Phytophthora cactorum]